VQCPIQQHDRQDSHWEDGETEPERAQDAKEKPRATQQCEERDVSSAAPRNELRADRDREGREGDEREIERVRFEDFVVAPAARIAAIATRIAEFTRA
jgi:hypothetical protein